MRKICLSMLCCALISAAFAQTEKGNIMVGGNFGLQTGITNNPYTNIQLMPTVGYFVADNIAVGAGLTTEFQTGNNVNLFVAGINPLVRYYIGSGKMKFFATVSPMIGGVTAWGSSSNSYGNGLMWGFMGGPGINIFLNDHVALEGLLSYNYSKETDFDAVSNLRFTVGVQAYLNGK